MLDWLREFFHMGGYGGYVFAAYAAATAMFAGFLLRLRAQLRRLQRQAQAQAQTAAAARQ